MEKFHKQMIKELDEIISRAPDVDIEYEYTQFCELHEGILWDLTTSISGLLPRILLVKIISLNNIYLLFDIRIQLFK